MGKPGVFVVTDNLIRDATSSAQDNGMPLLRIVSVPSENYYKARTSVKEMRPIAAGASETIVDALTRPLTQEEAKPTPISQQPLERTLQVSAESYSSANEKFNQLFLGNRWGDGLPIVPPTIEAVQWMLQGTNRSPDEVIGKVAIKNGAATIEKIAVNAVMAGARPEYLPVILAAMEALTDKNFDLTHLQASTGSITPIIIVNGPIIKELNINSGIGYLGHGWRANSTIGRAIRLCLINLGHMWPQANDMALTGREAAFGNFTFAENEVDSPWKPYHTDLGYKPEESTVTVSSTMWHIRQGPGGAVTVQAPKEALQILVKMLVEITFPTSPANPTWLPSKNYIIALDPGLARGLSEIGFSKETLKKWFFENARVPFSTLSQREISDLEGAVLGGQLPAHVLAKEQLKEGEMIPVVSGPEHIHVIVVGGMPGYAGVWCYPGPKSGHQTKRISGATLTHSGR